MLSKDCAIQIFSNIECFVRLLNVICKSDNRCFLYKRLPMSGQVSPREALDPHVRLIVHVDQVCAIMIFTLLQLRCLEKYVCTSAPNRYLCLVFPIGRDLTPDANHHTEGDRRYLSAMYLSTSESSGDPKDLGMGTLNTPSE